MSLLNNAPVPYNDALVRLPKSLTDKDKMAGLLSDTWQLYFDSLLQTVTSSPQRANAVQLEAQGASIGATDMSGGGIGAGLYRITWNAQITRAAATSSSLTVTFGWTQRAVPQSRGGVAITGNSISSGEADKHLLIYADRDSPITYSTTYASVGAPSMQYSLDVVLELVKV